MEWIEGKDLKDSGEKTYFRFSIQSANNMLSLIFLVRLYLVRSATFKADSGLRTEPRPIPSPPP
jgi:hypothetical protein